MTLCHSYSILRSPALAQVEQYLQAWQSQRGSRPPDFEQFEREVHERLLAVEREVLQAELAEYDVTAEQVEVAGVVYQPALTSTETYLTAAGPIKVERHLYRPAGRSSKSICPLELRAGIIQGYWTPGAARQAAYVLAHLTPGESEALFAQLGGMQPARASLDRLPKVLSSHWELQRPDWEAALRLQETVPAEASIMAISADGVTLRMKGGAETAQPKRPGKHGSGPTGQREAGCGTVVLDDAQGERLQTIRYGRMPERGKATLQDQLQTEAVSIVSLRPDLRRILLADGAEPNWRLLAAVDQACGPPSQPSVEIVDFYHACDHLKEAGDATWGESTPRSHAEFERLKTLLKEDETGVERVIRVLTYHRGRAHGRKRTRLTTQLTYFRNQRQRMAYAEYTRHGWPIASGVIEATCKTLVTQRLKQSGMAWSQPGGQAILTWRSLIQSDRWPPAWNLLRADFRQTVIVKERTSLIQPDPALAQHPVKVLEHSHYAALPLAAD
jgi:hypothetical protein